MAGVRHHPGISELARQVGWQEVFAVVNQQLEAGSAHSLTASSRLPTFVCRGGHYTGAIARAFEELSGSHGVTTLHLYVSFGPAAETFRRHQDDSDVLIVQAIGRVSYRFDDGSAFSLAPGDGLLIPACEHHEPLVEEARVTLSFSWD